MKKTGLLLSLLTLLWYCGAAQTPVQTDLRSFYKLEELWADAPMVKYEYEE